jgi:hypothetical protein
MSLEESGFKESGFKESKTCASAIGKLENFEKDNSGKIKTLTLEEIKILAEQYKANGTLKPSWLWEQLYRLHHKDECLLSEGDKAKLNHKYKTHDEKVIAAMYAVMESWSRFAKKAEANQGAFTLPYKPAVGFFCQYLTDAVGMSQKPVQAVTDPTSKNPITGFTYLSSNGNSSEENQKQSAEVEPEEATDSIALQLIDDLGL